MDQIIRSRDVKTNKDHKCCGCERVIPAGSKMQVVTSSDQERVYTSHWCAVCQRVLHEAGYEYGELVTGDLRWNSPELWEETRKKVEGT